MRWKDGGEGVGKGVYRVIIEVGHQDIEIQQPPLTRADPEPSLGNTDRTGEVPHPHSHSLSLSLVISDPSYCTNLPRGPHFLQYIHMTVTKCRLQFLRRGE